MNNLAARYYHWRKSFGSYSQAQLARDVGATKTTAENWCSGKSNPDKRYLKVIKAVIAEFEQTMSEAAGSKIRMR